MFKIHKSLIFRYLLNAPGWHTKRKIVVLESDDWGSIRMPSKEVYDILLDNNISVDQLSYNRYDSLASEDDLSSLFDVLSSIKDKNGNFAKMTANTIVANPDFEKIRESNFQNYFYEPFIDTLKKYPNHQNSFNLWKEGISAGLFKPQFHGREHLNVSRWLKALRSDNQNLKLAFKYGLFDLSTSIGISENSFMEALNIVDEDEYDFQRKSIIEGADLFQEIFGYRSKTFIAPCYIWSNQLNKTFKDSEIQCFQGNWFQLEPKAGGDHKFKKYFHYTGQRNNLNQIYLVRNAAFEPSENFTYDWINDVVNRAKIVFSYGKPLIISSHRQNFIGFIDEKNREKNLKLLKELLSKLMNLFPDVEFLSSDELYDEITKQS
jgi:hypothetical protein